MTIADVGLTKKLMATFKNNLFNKRNGFLSSFALELITGMSEEIVRDKEVGFLGQEEEVLNAPEDKQNTTLVGVTTGTDPFVVEVVADLENNFSEGDKAA